MKDINIAIHNMGGANWTGGAVYIKNLLYAFEQINIKRNNISLVMSSRDYAKNENYPSFSKYNKILYEVSEFGSPIWVLDMLIKRALFRDMILEKSLKEQQIDVIFGPAIMYKYSKIATLSWLPDFQHIHYPNMFNKDECVSRNSIYLQCAKRATRIVLMSEAVKEDFKIFSPSYLYKVRILHPVCNIPSSIYDSNLDSILHGYNLPEKFIFMPNQFWKHKNHLFVFTAIKRLKEEGIKVNLVCTGNPIDTRHPTYFADLWRKISSWDIRDQIIYLGLVPEEHIPLLMRQSICVLNPSLFEGWGMTVDEASSIGKQVLLSDIPAHHEQNLSKAVFFNPNDIRDFEVKLRDIWEESSPGPDYKLERDARLKLPKRIHAYGEAFMAIVEEAINSAEG